MADQNLRSQPGETIQQYEARLGSSNQGVGTGFNLNQKSGQPQQPNQGQMPNAPSGLFGGTQPAGAQFNFQSYLQTAVDRLNTMNPLLQQKNLLVEQLYGQPITIDQIATLSQPIQQTIHSGNRDQMEMQLRLLNDQIAGRQSTLNTSMQFLAQGYQQSVTAAETQRQDALQSVNQFITQYGSNAGNALKSLYGQDYVNQLKNYGVNLDQLEAIPTINQERYYNPFATDVSGNTMTTGGMNNIAKDMGIADASISLKDVVSQKGVDSVINAIVQNEGSSPTGVVNNPGNIKYTGQPGQTDSGVKATDGGTFASYATPQDGRNAIADIVTRAASGQSQTYGSNPTLADFAGTYTGTGNQSQISQAQYGLLSNVSDFNPSNAIDSAAVNYINQLVYQGKAPTAASVGVSLRTGSGAIFNTIANRANQLLTEATGAGTPMLSTIQGYQKILNENNTLANNLKVQEGTISQNFGLSLENLNDNNINQSIPIINAMANAFQNAMGDPNVAQYISQNVTLQNEAASLIAVKNAAGTTVYDKMESAGLIPANASQQQQQQVLKTLLQEAGNASDAITKANDDIYKVIDPLQKDPNNPNKKSTSQTAPQDIQTDMGRITSFYKNGSFNIPNHTDIKTREDLIKSLVSEYGSQYQDQISSMVYQQFSDQQK